MTTTDSFTFIDLFAGIGGMRLPFEEMGGRCVFSSEIDLAACETYKSNFNEWPQGDITQIAEEDIPDHDVLLAGFPCQAFSIIGKRLGFADTRGTLFFEIERILREKKPRMFLLENVPQLITIQKGRVFEEILLKLEELHYCVHWKVLNSLDYGLPQSRRRVYLVGFDRKCVFQFPKGTRKYDLNAILETDSKNTNKFEATDYIKQKRADAVKGKNIFYPSIWHENKSGNISIHDHSCALRANASHNYLLVNGTRHFTPRELLRLQGFPEWFNITGNYSRIRSQAGNSVAVPVVRAVAQAMLGIIGADAADSNNPQQNDQRTLQKWTMDVDG